VRARCIVSAEGVADGFGFAVSSAIADIGLAVALVWKLRSVRSSFQSTQRCVSNANLSDCVLKAHIACFVGLSSRLSRLVCCLPLHGLMTL
jgi:hypothetical protein